MVTENGTVKIMDFGLALAVGATRITMPGAICGTPLYMAPEQVRDDEDLGQAVDTYAMGCMAYELLSGKPLFTEGNIAAQHLNKTPRPLKKVRPDVPALLEKIIMKCTGDGFFACFSHPRSAIKAALKTGPKLKKHIKKAVQICIALHWGKSRLAEDGDRTGKDVHCVFDLEKLRHRIHRELIYPHGVNDLILMTETFWKELGDYTGLKAMPVGRYELKGLEKKETVYLLQR